MDNDKNKLQPVLTMLHMQSKCLIENENLKIPYTPLCGEAIEYIGRSFGGILTLSNYRLFHINIGKKDYYFNVPLGLLENVTIDKGDITSLQISCKDARKYKCCFSTSEQCQDWSKRIIEILTFPKNKDVVFAFLYFLCANEDMEEDIRHKMCNNFQNSIEISFRTELERLKFDVQSGNVWRVSSINKEFKLSSTYPRYLIVPASIPDTVLESAAKFRSYGRIPAVVWRHPINGAVIARCSQPEVGWLGRRSSHDEELLKEIAMAGIHPIFPQQIIAEKMLLIIDARSYTSAVANRARGGGCEYPEYYADCEIKFMCLANIHSVRKSFSALQVLCAMPADQTGWFGILESTGWLYNLSGLLQAAMTVVSAVEYGRPVIVHCSDGWDRTPQIVSLAEILLDPYYRTIDGFQILIEREWLEYGHKFADRCASEDINEQCPIFLQWLDCIQNLMKQFPCAFEFSVNYLVKLVQHTYSDLFGTFLCNSSDDRIKRDIEQRTFSVWRFLRTLNFQNYLYSPAQHKILWPVCNERDLKVWHELYLSSGNESLELETSSFCKNKSNKNIDQELEVSELEKTVEQLDCEIRSDNFLIKGTFEDLTCNNFENLSNKKLASEVITDTATSLEREEGEPNFTSQNWNYFSSNDINVENSTNYGRNKIVQRSDDNYVSALILDPIDGLPSLKDCVQDYLRQMTLEHESRVTALMMELKAIRLALEEVSSKASVGTMIPPGDRQKIENLKTLANS